MVPIFARNDVVTTSSIRERIPFVVLGVKNCLFFFVNFPVSRARPEKLCDFYSLQLQITCKSAWIAQAKKKDTASAKKGKVSLQRRGG